VGPADVGGQAVGGCGYGSWSRRVAGQASALVFFFFFGKSKRVGLKRTLRAVAIDWAGLPAKCTRYNKRISFRE
jgi:hypothetical protein